MADGGVSLSLDDYIKVKRKQGGFKTARGAAKVRTQQQRKGGGRAIQQRGQKQGQKKAGNQVRQQQRKIRQVPGGGGRYFNTASPQRQGQNPRVRNQRFRGLRNQVKVTGIGKNRAQRQRQVGGVRNTFQGRVDTRGISQNLLRANKRARGRAGRQAQITPLMRSNGLQMQMSNRLKGYNNTPRPNNRRVMKLVQKRVQRARLQLNGPRVGIATGRVGRPMRGILTTQSGVRRSRNGFITVRSSAEKKHQRLIIQEKIARARLARNGSQNGIRNQNNRNRVAVVSRDPVMRVQVPNERRRERYSYQPNRSRPLQSSQVQQYDPYVPTTMYADQAVYGSPSGRSGIEARGRWSPPIVRTTTNHHYRAVKHEDDYDDQMNQSSSLNAEIQRKISFIQNRSRAVASPGIIPDFRGPVASSTVKLGDRFRLYMH